MSEKTRIDLISEKPWFPTMVWTLRLLIGAVFMFSGFVKGIDLWGFVFKLEEYLAVWDMTQPRSLVLIAAILISGYEFVFGLLLAMGCYKRVAVWALLLQMAVMLPLTLYIAVADPVSDCGCFGDVLILSNVATFLKNLVLTAALVWLLVFNPRLKQGMFEPTIQWIVVVCISLYFITIGLYGYNIQPMIDFRPYPIGASLVPDDEEDATDESASTDESSPTEDQEASDDAEEIDSEEDMTFVYEKDGERREFSIDDLPDSTWTFVERVEHSVPAVEKAATGAELRLYDIDGEDVTEEVLQPVGREILLVIPEPRRIDISYTYFLNDLKAWADTMQVRMAALIAGDRRAMEFLSDISMASYDIYSAEDTKLKELVRGTMSIVELDSGVVKTKYTLSSIPDELLEGTPRGSNLLERMAPRPGWWLRTLTLVTLGFLVLLYLFQSMVIALYKKYKVLKARRKLHKERQANAPAEADDSAKNP